MENFKISEDLKNKIFVACPPYTVTGGIELLHQVVHRLNSISNNRYQSFICYWGGPRTLEVPDTPKDYKKYGNPSIKNIPNGCNNNYNTIIVPEIYALSTSNPLFHTMKKVIYWESVDNYFNFARECQLKDIPKDTIHLAQSYYAYDFLIDKVKIDPDNVIYVTDYLNSDYLIKDVGEPVKRKEQVLYNPAKGLDFTKKIIQNTPGVKFIPIENMSRDEVKKLMKESMLYIDFGSHPGKDRIPREACISGCNIMVGKVGSALNSKDMPIKDCYKFDINDDHYNMLNISNSIRTILGFYEKNSKNFEEYRKMIYHEPKEFAKGIDKLIERLGY